VREKQQDKSGVFIVLFSSTSWHIRMAITCYTSYI